MNNLIFHNLIPITEFAPDEQANHFCQANDSLYIIANKTLYNYKLHPERKQIIVKHTDEHFCPTTPIKEIHGRYLAFGTGHDIILVDVQQKLVHACPIDHVSLSFNDSAEFALVKEQKVVETYYINEDGIILKRGETTLDVDNPENQYINLGWGSETTQFKGKRRTDKNQKPSASQTETTESQVSTNVEAQSNSKSPEVTETTGSLCEPIDDVTKPHITWSCDNNMFVVNYYCSETETRTFKIFSETCNLLYKGASIEGLQPQTAWKPPKSVLAFPVVTPSGSEIHFYEKLGPIRDQFTLPNNLPVSSMKWSHDAMFLGIVQKGDSKTMLSIYMPKTGRWYLKQFLNFLPPNDLKDFEFIKTDSKTLVSLSILTQQGFFVYTFKIGLISSPLLAQENCLAACAVVDGSLVEIHNFTRKVLPPSMGECRIVSLNPINEVIFHPFTNQVLLWDSEGMIRIYSYDDTDSELICEYAFENANGLPFSNKVLLWNTSNYLEFTTFLGCSNPRVNVSSINLNEKLSATQNQSKMLMGLWEKSYAIDGKQILEQFLTTLSVKCPDSRLVFRYKYDSIILKQELIAINNTDYLFCLLENKRFYLNRREIANNVSSFIIHGRYLHFTKSSSNQLFTVMLDERTLRKIEQGKMDWSLFPKRPVETGALLVMGIPKQPEVILQMPRGNLETIKIEMVLMDVVEDLLTKGEWARAHDYIRMQKMDSNILVDLDFDRFIDNLSNIIKSIASPSLISQFIEELNNSSSSCDTYFHHYMNKPRILFEEKIDVVCEKFIYWISESSSYAEYLLPVVIACIVSDPENGLSESFDHMSLLVEAMGDQSSVVQSIVEAIKYLKNKYVEAELLSKALCTFNWRLVRITADAINMDPMEYLPLLKRLESLEEIEMRFQVYDYIKDYGMAVVFLYRMGNLEALFEYVKHHNLYEVCIEELPREGLEELRKIYANSLAKNGSNQLAFAFYVNLQEMANACEVAQRGLFWQEAVELLEEMRVEDRQDQLVKMSKRMGNHPCKATIYEEFKNIDERFTTFLQMNQWVDALIVLEEAGKMINNHDTFSQSFKTHLTTMSTELEEIEKTFQNYYDRLERLRVEKTLFSHYGDHEEEHIYAESVTGSSRSTGQSKNSSRERRKLERKITSLRPGGQYEDIALQRALVELATKISKLHEDVPQMITIEQVLSSGEHDLDMYIKKLDNFQKHVRELLPKICNAEEIFSNEHQMYLDSEYTVPVIQFADWSIGFF